MHFEFGPVREAEISLSSQNIAGPTGSCYMTLN